jgi:hypothetical protein
VTAFPQVPGYEIESELGRGGMAVVYKAVETDLGRDVAIKIVKADPDDNEGHIQRLENEARGLAALHHPHIVDLYRFGHLPDGALYYVMPLLPGGTLEEVPKPMPEDKVVALLDHLLDALAHAHATDIIHRDIKPSNILFDRHGRPMLADFGAAFMRRRDTRITEHGEAIGSSGFMSPEQARGQRVDARSDLYSVAVLAFELLTGQLPWKGEDGLATALAQIEQPVPRLPDALKHWQAFFYRALAVNPEHRYAGAAAMRAAIHALLKPPRQSLGWTGLAAGLAVAVLALGGLGYSLWRSRVPPTETVRTATVLRPPAADIATPANSETVQTPAATAEPLPELAPAAKPAKVGDRFTDPGGPELVLARTAKGTRPALAVMAAPVDAPLYKRYADFRKRKRPSCGGAPPHAQGCLDLSTANDFAKWLSEETGEKYRVPTRTELDATIAQVARVPAYAWTGTCNEVRVARSANVAKRSWARVRKVFGKPKPVEYDIRCDGHFALKLDGHGESAKVERDGSPATVLVLVRDVRVEK